MSSVSALGDGVTDVPEDKLGIMPIYSKRLWTIFGHCALYAPYIPILLIAGATIACALCRIGVPYSFNVNEGWNAYWASAAWNGSELYPPPNGLRLDPYLPLWFYVTGALGHLLRDNITAGRVVATLALFLNSAVVFMIVRQLTKRQTSAWFAAATFLALCGLFFADYVAANDPQLAANLLMTVALFLFVRKAEGRDTLHSRLLIVTLLLAAGLIKHNVLAVPISIAIFLLIYRRMEFLAFAAWSTAGLIVVCAMLYLIFHTNLFASLLFPRSYDVSSAWEQTTDQLASFNLLLLVVPFLALQASPAVRLIFIYTVVSLMEGLILSGGFGVDVNVFLDFAIATAIGIGLLQNATLRAVGNQPGRWQTAVSLAVWIAVALTPFVLASQQGFQKTKEIFNTLTNNPQRADVAYIKTKPGPAICENPALCYWAGKDFGVDVNNLKILTFGQPQVERELIAQLTSCFYAVIQVSTDDWDDDEDGRFTAAIIGILKKDYTIAWKNGETQYFVPCRCTTISRRPRDPNVSR
jgi:hypothetical protein